MDVLKNLDAIDDVTGKPVEIVLDEIYSLFDKGSIGNSNYNNLNWKFAQEHIKVQQRINEILAFNFCIMYWKGINVPELNDHTLWNFSNKQQSYNPINGVTRPLKNVPPIDDYLTRVIGMKSGKDGNWTFEWKAGTSQTGNIFNRAIIPYQTLTGTTVFLYPTNFTAMGWQAVHSMHWNSVEEAMKGIFKSACNVGLGNWQGVELKPNDDYKAYQYPTPSLTARYGSNLGYFKRCAVDNIGCQLFGIDISTSTALMIVAGVVATIVSAGGAAAWLATSISTLTKVWPKAGELVNSAESAQDFVGDLQSISNGADIEADDKAAVANFATTLLQGSQLFEQQ